MKSSLLTGVLVVMLFFISGCELLAPSPSSPTPVSSPTAIPTPVPISTPTTAPGPVPLPPIVQVVSKVKPAVVSIVTEWVEQSFFLQPVPRRGAGSGIIISSDGYILTNNHVVSDAQKITVSLPPSQALPEGGSLLAEVVGRDPLTDLAVLKVKAGNLPAVVFGDSERLMPGEWVVAIGNAEALPGGPTVTQGIISAVGRSITTQDGVTLNDLIQTDAAINPGNSGGPLVNMAGEVVGINSAILAGAQNIGFAISSATAIPVKDNLIQFGRVVWPWLGISGATMTSAIAAQRNLSVTKGVLIDGVSRGSPADRAGLRQNDVIISLAGQKLDTIEQLQRAIRKRKIGETVEVGFVRGTETKTVGVALAEMSRQF